METVSFQPVTVTAETLQRLSKQDKYPELLALYMSYVEMTTWQHNNSIKATTDFMAKRLHWTEKKIRTHKKTLTELGLIEDIIRKDETGKITGHYILVKYVVNPHSPLDYGVDSNTPNTNNYKESTNNSNFVTNVTKGTEGSRRRKDIDDMFAYWEQQTGLPILSRVLANRYACSNLIRKYGDTRLRELVQMVAAAQNDRYGPKVADFSALQADTNKLLVWAKGKSTSMEVI